MQRLGCLTPLGLMAAAIALLIAAGIVLASGGAMFSPGQLNAASTQVTLGGVKSHAAIGSRCAACHAEPWSNQTMALRCLACHADIRSQLGDPSSLHGAIQDATACRNCHTEHHGPQAALTRLDISFPHEKVGFSLARHQTQTHGQPFACADCHSGGLATFDRARCETCHQSYQADFVAHVQDFGRDCRACHDGVDRYTGFDHRKAPFQLAGKHTSVRCNECHINARTLSDLARAPQGCLDCHRKDDTHQGAFGAECVRCHSPEGWKQVRFDHNQSVFKLVGQHAQVACAQCHVNGVLKGTPQVCVDCHRKDDAHKSLLGSECARCHSSADWKQVKFDHNQSAFKLVGKHIQVTCTQCHTNRVFKSTPQTCIECHRKDDKHKSALGTDCAKCHLPEDWKQVKFDHNLSAFKLVGKHVPVACDKCHVNSVLKGTPQACVDCHRKDDKHQGAYGTNCAQCHTPEDWKKAKFDHNLSVFKLTGAHVNVTCAKCHVNNVFKGTPQTCVACHPEPQVHRGQFGADCVQCHTTTTWKGATFKHTFPLDHGERGRIACATCHTLAGNFKAYTCYGCHEHDPASIARKHSEERVSNIEDCVRCHPTGREKDGQGGD